MSGSGSGPRAFPEHLRLALRLRREVLGWSQQQVAKAAGMHQATVAQLELGKYDPTFEAFARWVGALGLEWDVVLRSRPRSADE